MSALWGVSLLSLLAGAGDAHAQTPATTTPKTDQGPTARPELPISMVRPESFVASPEQAKPLTYKLQAEIHLGGLRSRAYIAAWHSQSTPATLFVTWFITEEPIELPDIAIHSELENLRQTPERVSLSKDETEVVSWTTGIEDNVVVARLRWQHKGYQSETQVRALAFQTEDGHLYFVQADCVYPMSQESGSGPATDPSAVCASLLDSMNPAKHVGALRAPNPDALAQGVATADSGAAAKLGQPGIGGDSGSPSGVPQLSLRDPGAVPMPAMAIEREKKPNYMQYLYVAGAALLLLAFYLTARGRSSAQAAHSATPDDPDDGPGEDEDGGDDDDGSDDDDDDYDDDNDDDNGDDEDQDDKQRSRRE